MRPVVLVSIRPSPTPGSKGIVSEPRALTFDMTVMMTCSLTLNGPGLRLNLRPNNRHSRSGKIRSQPRPRGYATSWTIKVAISICGFRIDKSAL